MTITEPPTRSAELSTADPQRFVFNDADWDFYETVGRNLGERRVFATYYKGRLEVVTVSLLHERITALLAIMIRVTAEESSTPLGSAGMTTLKRMDLDVGVEPDSSFYTIHEERMRGKEELDLAVDPPPDLAIEVEATHRLGTRKSIYRDLGVPEVWVYSASNNLTVLIRKENAYVEVDRSPTFPQLSLRQMTEFVIAGLRQDETSFTKAFRKHVQHILAQP